MGNQQKETMRTVGQRSMRSYQEAPVGNRKRKRWEDMRVKLADWEPANLPHPHVHDDTGNLVPT